MTVHWLIVMYHYVVWDILWLCMTRNHILSHLIISYHHQFSYFHYTHRIKTNKLILSIMQNFIFTYLSRTIYLQMIIYDSFTCIFAVTLIIVSAFLFFPSVTFILHFHSYSLQLQLQLQQQDRLRIKNDVMNLLATVRTLTPKIGTLSKYLFLFCTWRAVLML